MSENLYKSKLSPEAYRVCRLAATEQPFSGEYNEHWAAGTYHCACCEKALFLSSTKFNAGCGWPSFYQALGGAVSYIEDRSLSVVRTEIQCLSCQSHLGHVFDDGPKPTGRRYCVNSLSLIFHLG